MPGSSHMTSSGPKYTQESSIWSLHLCKCWFNLRTHNLSGKSVIEACQVCWAKQHFCSQRVLLGSFREKSSCTPTPNSPVLTFPSFPPCCVCIRGLLGGLFSLPTACRLKNTSSLFSLAMLKEHLHLISLGTWYSFFLTFYSLFCISASVFSLLHLSSLPVSISLPRLLPLLHTAQSNTNSVPTERQWLEESSVMDDTTVNRAVDGSVCHAEEAGTV